MSLVEKYLQHHLCINILLFHLSQNYRKKKLKRISVVLLLLSNYMFVIISYLTLTYFLSILPK